MGRLKCDHIKRLITLFSDYCTMYYKWFFFDQLMSLESHLELRRGKEEWKHCQENVIDVMKKTLGKKS